MQIASSHNEAACRVFNKHSEPEQIISPYRVNPLGAHVDHQGGHVLARTINQNTLLSFWAEDSVDIEIVTASTRWDPTRARFRAGEFSATQNWVRYAQASAAAFAQHYPIHRGFKAYVEGSQIGAGLSSSASVVLAYLLALSHCNGVELKKEQLVDLVRQVENEYMGLNNGVQDQMSIVYGRKDAMTLLDVNSISADSIKDVASSEQIRWVLCYSGFSRELVNSSFNTRVEECRSAATALDAKAHILNDVAKERRSEQYIGQLDTNLANRARHFFSETARVESGAQAWQIGDWRKFGELMNQSCHSSITQYESGSQPMIDLHEVASACRGVYGSRFCGGGYGGCLLMLVAAEHTEQVRQQVFENYLAIYPEKRNIARISIAQPDDTVRVVAN